MTDNINFDIKHGKGGTLGIIELNRPQALNALNFAMCDAIFAFLEKAATNKNIKAVVIKAVPGKAFCAGGDIRKLYEHKEELKNLNTKSDFFQQEYRMNSALHHFPKPYIALLDGITMGGGCGISIHGSHRVATEKLLMAMPETAIGFYPDIGAGHFFNQCPGKSGWYLALTGNRIDAATALDVGLVTHTVSSASLSEIEQRLLATEFTDDAFAAVNKILNEFNSQLGESTLALYRPIIDENFNANSMEAIIANLQSIDDEFSKQTLQTLSLRSPTSLKVTLAHLQRAEKMSFDQINHMDNIVSKNFLQNNDFYEGIRAAVVDKDRKPKWQPATLADVSDERVANYFVA